MVWIILALVGLIGGTIGSLMGLGGGIIVVPALLFLASYSILEITPQIAVGTSLVIMIGTGLSATIAYVKQKKVDYKSGLLFFCASGPGAVVGAWLNRLVDTEAFQLLFGVFILLMATVLFIRKYLKKRPYVKKRIEREYIDTEQNLYTYGYNILPALSVAFMVGMLSGLFGIGGGSLMVPAMVVLFHFPPHLAVATSMFMILLSAMVGSVSHMVLGNVNWLYVLALLPGAWLGGIAGAALNKRLTSEKLMIVFRLMLIVIALRLIYEGIV
ncbi:sulfite exporter TauE/SafE family protein [Halalkalibacter akibai]|uniref:Probable membrane transporter protein n=1 Tax=Halalkalibacter akibai (strain ATCC 43226 / DSM 21942 / CIP 109018 / JCM 9157 / 1139) TaxID=1236973 RepID=W4QPF2_HALA3|nr:sulfite exporter TauE/SafE family protein [Halalkalibacter akibai]GAE33229.1 hypothetical protein JCM9157_220 [Halalkalibacter akibai JCM 9157]